MKNLAARDLCLVTALEEEEEKEEEEEVEEKETRRDPKRAKRR